MSVGRMDSVQLNQWYKQKDEDDQVGFIERAPSILVSIAQHTPRIAWTAAGGCRFALSSLLLRDS